MLVRTVRGHITLWSTAMEQRYGFTADDALGQLARQLLRTMFWQPLPELEALLAAQNSWSGGLLHRHANGRPMMTATHWLLHYDPETGERLVSELHGDIVPAGQPTAAQLADIIGGVGRDMTQSATAVSDQIDAANRALQPAWPDRLSLSQALAAAADHTARIAEGMALFRDLGDALRASSDAAAVPPPPQSNPDAGTETKEAGHSK